MAPPLAGRSASKTKTTPAKGKAAKPATGRAIATKSAGSAAEKPRSRKAPTRDELLAMYRRLSAFHADAHCELDHKNAFELICATVLSAQSTDVAVNRITPALFAAFPDARSLAAANPAEVEELVSRIGMYRQKSKNLIGLARLLVERHGGEVPGRLADLVELPGVGRKTANVVLGVAFGTPEGVVVDTHVQRISQRLKWTKDTEPPEIEQDLCKAIPKSDWDRVSHVLIFHGRRVCFAIKPQCATCIVNDACPSAFRAELVGRKAKRVRTR